MAYKSAGVQSAEQKPELSDYVSWSSPVLGAQIHMHPLALRALTAAATRDSRAEAPRESGGILFGKLVPSDRRQSVVITRTVFVDSESQLFNSDGASEAKLSAALASVGPDGAHPVGYFRTHLREGLCLSERDGNFVERYLPDPDFVSLILRPYETGICMAGFFFWHNGVLQTDDSDLEVPFFASDAADGNAPVILGEEIPDFEEADKLEVRFQALASPPLAEGRPKLRNRLPASPRMRLRLPRWLMKALAGLALAGLLALALAVGLPALRAYLQNLASGGQGELGLRVDRSGDGQLNLRWNRKFPEFAKIRHATLTIDDGSVQRKLDIDRDQLRFGQLTYFPIGKDVQFDLELYLDADRSLVEKVRVLLPGSARAGGAVSSPSDQAVQTVAPKKRLAAAAAPKQFHQASIEPKLLVNQIRTFQLPLVTGPPPQRRETQEAAPVISPGTFTDPSAIPSQATAVPVPPAAGLPAPRSLVPSIQASETVPRPIRRSMPQTRAFGRSLVTKPSSIRVRVQINERGQVNGAEVVNDGAAKNSFLVKECVEAAKAWTFVPALRGGKPAPSDFVIIFRFQPAE